MRARTLKFLVIISMLSSNFAQAAGDLSRLGPVVATKRTTKRQLLGYLKATPQRISFASWWLRKLEEQPEKDELVSRFLAAKEVYLEPTAGSPAEGFRAVLELRNMSPWSQDQHQLLFHSSLRALELAKSQEDQKVALAMAAIVGFYLKPNPHVFSPPIVKRFSEAKQKIKLITVPVTGWMKGFEKLIYNGQVIDLAQRNSIQLVAGEFLFLFLSSKFEPLEVKTKTEGLIAYRHENRPLVGLGCELSELAMTHTPSAMIIDADHLCGQRVVSKPISSALSERAMKPLDLKPRSSETKHPIEATSVLAVKKKKPWWKNKWLWIGLAAATTAYVVYDQDRRGNGQNRKTRSSGEPAPSVSFED